MYVDDETRLRHMSDAAREAIAIARRRVPGDFQNAHPDVPWRQIVGMRHMLVHDYDRIDVDKVWSVVDEDLPRLVSQIELIVPPWSEPD